MTRFMCVQARLPRWLPTLCSSKALSTVASQVMQAAPRLSSNAGLDSSYVTGTKKLSENLQPTHHERFAISPRTASIFTHP